MFECLKKYMPKNVSWTEPQGGLFIFVTPPVYLEADRIFLKSIEKNVAFVSGTTFFCDGSGHNTMRLNFSFSNNEEIESGVKQLALVIAK